MRYELGKWRIIALWHEMDTGNIWSCSSSSLRYVFAFLDVVCMTVPSSLPYQYFLLKTRICLDDRGRNQRSIPMRTVVDLLLQAVWRLPLYIQAVRELHGCFRDSEVALIKFPEEIKRLRIPSPLHRNYGVLRTSHYRWLTTMPCRNETRMCSVFYVYL